MSSLTAGVVALWGKKSSFAGPTSTRNTWQKRLRGRGTTSPSPAGSHGPSSTGQRKHMKVIASFRLGSQRTESPQGKNDKEHDGPHAESGSKTKAPQPAPLSRRHSMPTIKAVNKVRMAIKSNKFKALVKARIEEEKEAEMAALEMNPAGRKSKRHSLVAIGAGVVDADRKQQLKDQLARTAASSSQALALQMLEKPVGGVLSGMMHPKVKHQNPQKAVPVGRFEGGAEEVAARQAERERKIAAEVKLYGVGQGLQVRTWELHGVFPVRRIKKKRHTAASNQAVSRLGNKGMLVKRPPDLPYPKSLDDLDHWTVQ